ncbi:hypothetical protein FDG2_4964 [Candidatus Protofrankia californiensis]|uniref:Novel STAND NTPase 1 domain-containing protein n=1 Tax=Candidatus Protofrankia californiensis TaxID=1839754 RepID=A0A1C3P9R4_9ACTN|nr:hypothetical protein FDG2_4964 [Candidatus Protofrankia californiensis]
MPGRDRIVPLLLEPCEIPLRVDFRVRLDCTDHSRWEAETARLRALLDQPEPPGDDDLTCPYPGLAPFGRERFRFFHGREREVADLARKLRHQPFVLVVGPSGSGKSSLVLAGVVPRLGEREQGRWLVRTLRPGPAPLSALAGALGTVATDTGDALRVRTTADVPAAAVIASPELDRAVRELLARERPAEKILLVVDQMEEVFAQASAAERTAFLTALIGLRGIDACRVVATMRADFYPELMESELWPLDPGDRVEVAPLRGADLRRVIERPAADVGVHLDRGLTERLIADAADEPGALPLLQETMVTLWDERERRLLSLAAYEALGSGGRNGLAAVLTVRADGALSTLSPAQRAIARRVFLRLIQLGEGRDDTRRQQPVAALRAAGEDPALFDATLTHLIDQRLLTLSGGDADDGDADDRDADDRARRVDLAHEALIAVWPTLRDWIKKNRQSLRTARQTADDAHQWDAGERDPSDLYRGARLATALEWADSHRDELNVLERDFLDASRAGEASDLEAARRTNRRLGMLVRALGALLALAVGASGLAVFQSVRAGRPTAPRRKAARRCPASLPRRPSPRSPSRCLARSCWRWRRPGPTTRPRPEARCLRRCSARTAGSSPSRGPADAVRSLAFSPDGHTVATGSDSGKITFWDVALRRPRGSPLAGHRAAIQSLTFSPDGRTLASGGLDGATRLWDAASGQPIGQPLRAGEGQIWATAFSPDGALLAAAGTIRGGQDGAGQDGGGLVVVWDVREQRPREEFTVPGGRTVASVTFDHGGARLSAAGLDGSVTG